MGNVHVTDHDRMGMFILLTLVSSVKQDNASVKWFMKDAQSRLSIHVDVDGTCSKRKETFDSILHSLYKSEAT